MRLLMLSRDPKIFEAGSEVRSRMLDYAKSVAELNIVVFSRCGSGAERQNERNLHLYPARSLWDMYRIGQKVIHDSRFTIHDLITAQDPFETGLIGYFLKKQRPATLELQIHTDFLSPYFWRESLKNKIRVILAKFLIKKADNIRVVSERIKESLLALYPKPYTLSAIVVRPIFIDTEKIRNASIRTDLHKKYPGRFIVLMASRLTQEKNIPLAIAAMREVSAKYSQALLLIVGDGPEYKNFKFQISNFKLNESIILEPYTDDLASYYKTADLFLLTSNYEGYGRTVVEAQVAGLPVLMTDVGVAIGDVFPVGDLASLTSKLSGYLAKSKI